MDGREEGSPCRDQLLRPSGRSPQRWGSVVLVGVFHPYVRNCQTIHVCGVKPPHRPAPTPTAPAVRAMLPLFHKPAASNRRAALISRRRKPLTMRTPFEALGLDLPTLAARHAAALHTQWLYSDWTPEYLEATVQGSFDADVAALTQIVSPSRDIDHTMLRQAYAWRFAEAWGDLQAALVLQ